MKSEPYKVDVEKVKEYMLKNYGVTPENIDEKIEELRKKAKEKLRMLEDK